MLDCERSTPSLPAVTVIEVGLNPLIRKRPRPVGERCGLEERHAETRAAPVHLLQVKVAGTADILVRIGEDLLADRKITPSRIVGHTSHASG